ncbi:unnamed protein product [Rotaria sp. Silwood2]|nr:unnamed protein product [Rotaria sp. Silwood2]
MLSLISEENCLYAAEKLEQFRLKPVETIKQMTKCFNKLTRWSRIKIPLADDYSKIKVYTWYLRSLLYLALKTPDRLQLQRLEHIVQLSNTYFPSSLPNDNISNAEELLFTWLNIMITPSLRKKLPECFDQQQQQELQKYDNKKPIWLTYNLLEPIVLLFHIIELYYNEEDNEENDDDNEWENESNNNDEIAMDIEDEEDDITADDLVVIPFLKLNGVPTNENDYNLIPVTKMRFQNILEFLISMLCGPLLDLSSCHDIQYLIDRFHAVGFKNELLSNAFYEAALGKTVGIFRLKCHLYALEINDPIRVHISTEQKQFPEKRHNICCEQMKNLFDGALQLSLTDKWKIKVHMGYAYYFLFGHYSEAIDIMKTTIEDYNVDTKLNQTELVIPTIVLAYYTLFQCYRMTGQWDNGKEYIEQFKQICARLETDFKEDYNKSVVKLLLATSYFCLALINEAFDLISQVTETLPELLSNSKLQLIENLTDLSDELMSLCGIQNLLCLKDAQHFLDHGLTLTLPYSLSECGGENEEIHTRPQLGKQPFPTLIVRHGYDCYKMRPWLINPLTILDELKKWISRLPVEVGLEG